MKSEKGLAQAQAETVDHKLKSKESFCAHPKYSDFSVITYHTIFEPFKNIGRPE